MVFLKFKPCNFLQLKIIFSFISKIIENKFGFQRRSIHVYKYYLFLFSTGNPLLTSKVNILINVLDVNEFPPEISVPYETAVCENAKPGQVWCQYSEQSVCSGLYVYALSFKSRQKYTGVYLFSCIRYLY